MPLIISASGNSAPTATVVEKGVRYEVIAGGDSSYVIMNNYTGTFTISNSGAISKLPTIINKDGTVLTSSYTTYSAKDISALKLFQQVNHISSYYITFN